MICMVKVKSFSCVRLSVTQWTPLSMGFSRQEYWSGLPFPSPMHESESEVAQLCPTLSDPMDSSVHGIFQARILEWVAISFSRGSSRPRGQTGVSCISCFGRQILYHKNHLGSTVRQLVSIQFVHTLHIQRYVCMCHFEQIQKPFYSIIWSLVY